MLKFLKNLLIMYVISGLMALLAFALFSTQLEEGTLKGTSYNQAFTLHFFIMIFLFIVPAIPSLFYRSFEKKSGEEVE